MEKHARYLAQLAFGLLLIYLTLAAGYLIAAQIGNLLPPSMIGMILMVLLLQLKLLPLSWVEATANLFVRWMAILFVPICVALVDQLDLLRSALPALFASCVLGTLALLGIVGRFYQWLEKRP